MVPDGWLASAACADAEPVIALRGLDLAGSRSAAFHAVPSRQSRRPSTPWKSRSCSTSTHARRRALVRRFELAANAPLASRYRAILAGSVSVYVTLACRLDSRWAWCARNRGLEGSGPVLNSLRATCSVTDARSRATPRAPFQFAAS